jgi:DNA-binding MarR family transcriptional regulator
MPRPKARHEALADELRQVVSALRRRARTELAGSVIPEPQLLLLRRLESDGAATTADLARAEAITPQAAGGIVAMLETKGFVDKSADARDGRRRVVSLTKAGRKALAARHAARRSWLAAKIADSLDAREQRALGDALALLRKLVAS